MMLSAFGWTIMISIARSLQEEIHTLEIVFFRSAFALIFFLPWFWGNGFKGLRTQRIGMHLARGLAGLAAIYLLFGALLFIPMGDVAAITFTRPLLASVGAVIFLHEVARGHRWIATGFGLIGAYIIVRPGISPLSPGQIMALACVVAMAISSLTVKSLARTEHPDVTVMYQIIVFTTLSLIPALFVWTMPTLEQFALLISLGVAGVLTQRAMTRSYTVADATVVLPFEYTRLPFAALMGLLLFDEFPDQFVWLGGTVIFVATTYMAHRETRELRAGKGFNS
jgi:drug/metabolite transporter (DMT)-like permease